MRDFAVVIFLVFVIAFCLWGSIVGSEYRDKIQADRWQSNEATQYQILTRLDEIERQLNQCQNNKDQAND